MSLDVISTNRGAWATRWSDGKVGGGGYMCGSGLGSIRGKWLALRVTLGKVSGTTRGTATRRARSSDRHLTLFFVFTSVGWSPKSKNSSDLGHFKISPLGKPDPL